MIVKGNDGSTTKGRGRIPLFSINCGTMRVLK
jgi:hypothetical protein